MDSLDLLTLGTNECCCSRFLLVAQFRAMISRKERIHMQTVKVKSCIRAREAIRIQIMGVIPV